MSTAQETSPQRREDTTAGVDESRPGSHQSTSTANKADITDSPPRIVDLEIDKITADDSVRTRAKVDEQTIWDYAHEMQAGKTFPPLTVFSNGKSYWLSDGFHRLEAAKRASRDKIKAEVRKGTRHDAIKFGFKANDRHGLRRTNADKRYAVTMALREFRGLGSNAIAELCGVDHQLVAKVRRQLGDSPSSTIGRDGKTRKVRTKATSTESVPMSRPAEAPAESQDAKGEQDVPTALAAGVEAPASPVQPDEQKAIAAPVTGHDVVEGENAPPVSGDDVPATPQTAEITVPAGGEQVEFVLADGSRRQVPWFHNRLTFRGVDDHVQDTKAFYESKDAFPKYDQPTLVKFQNALISAASLAGSILGNNPTSTDLEIVHHALDDIRGMLPDLPRT